MRKFILLLFTIFSIQFVYSQNANSAQVSYGLGALYNFQTKGIGFDIRAKIPVIKKYIYTVPRVSYFPKFNKINELFGGLDIEYFPIEYYPVEYGKLQPYTLLGGYYNDWMNSSLFINKVAKKNNYELEGGVGLLVSFNCINPFIEWRYNTKWKEGTIVVGVLFCLKKCFSFHGGAARKCPKF